jgi:hypothetical protein
MDQNNFTIPKIPRIEVKENPKQRTIYDASISEIFWKNFLVGFGKTLGSLFLYMVFIVVSYYLFSIYVLPKFMPMINKMFSMVDTIEKLQKIQTPQINIPSNLNSVFQNSK